MQKRTSGARKRSRNDDRKIQRKEQKARRERERRRDSQQVCERRVEEEHEVQEMQTKRSGQKQMSHARTDNGQGNVVALHLFQLLNPVFDLWNKNSHIGKNAGKKCREMV